MASPKTVSGYDPVSVQIINMDTTQSENLPPSKDEVLNDMVRLWRRKQKTLALKDTGGVQQQAAACSAPALHRDAARAALKGGTCKSPSTPGKPGQVKATDNAETRKQAPPFNAWDFPSLENAQTKVSGWVGAASETLYPSPTEVALQGQNAELRRHTEIVAKKIHELEAKLARLAEPQAQAGSSEPMQQTEPENLDDRASVASGLSSDSQCTAISVGNMSIMENQLETLERTIADMPCKILEGVRASFRELWQRELPQIVESITPIVTDSVRSIVHGTTGVQFRNSRSRSRSPRPDTRRRTVAPRQTTGSEEHIPAASFPEMMVSLPEAPSPSGIRPAPPK
ncbi:hypothetical protein HPB50_002771 [Hyalomma asiaticum]|uniref:Uncharacterized protein n=1 Tax=Hyalomma asiaticum TaxID=266040 RepID=A0ACB7S3U0_HYAAI|nr:hypothetical protein HPB50_002771 [Hyalomma asiaticum]